MGVCNILNVTDHRDMILILTITTYRKQECIKYQSIVGACKNDQVCVAYTCTTKWKKTVLEIIYYTQNSNYNYKGK